MQQNYFPDSSLFDPLSIDFSGFWEVAEAISLLDLLKKSFIIPYINLFRINIRFHII